MGYKFRRINWTELPIANNCLTSLTHLCGFSFTNRQTKRKSISTHCANWYRKRNLQCRSAETKWKARELIYNTCVDLVISNLYGEVAKIGSATSKRSTNRQFMRAFIQILVLGIHNHFQFIDLLSRWNFFNGNNLFNCPTVTFEWNAEKRSIT